MTKAQKIIGCVQHDCAECKTMRRVYRAAMRYWRHEQLPVPLTNGAVVNGMWSAAKAIELEMKIEKACAAAAKKGKK